MVLPSEGTRCEQGGVEEEERMREKEKAGRGEAGRHCGEKTNKRKLEGRRQDSAGGKLGEGCKQGGQIFPVPGDSVCPFCRLVTFF